MYTPVEIVDLRTRPDYLPSLADCHQQEWELDGTVTTSEERAQRLQEHLSDEEYPVTWVALDGKQLVGSVSLIHYGNRVSTKSVWLANLFVIEGHREQGIGKQLVDHACAYAFQHGQHRLRLFTPKHKAFYAALGWEWCHSARVQRQWVDIMLINLHTWQAQRMLSADTSGSQTNGVRP
ncbi:hypothetical protein NBRC116494_04720 [Aurantivibrio plasticivorans]